MELKVVEGRKSPNYNHFAEYELASCRATETRLMGAVALKLTWQDSGDARRRYYQLIHLDYSEYGVDEYLEFDCLPGEDDYADIREEMQGRWNRFISVMGGRAVSITPACMLKLLESALELAGDDIKREYDSDENVRFRHFAIHRLDMMREVLLSRGITSDSCPVHDATDAVSVSNIGQYGTINYFLMRLLDRDFDAASILTDIPADELRKSPLAAHGIQALMRNSITKIYAGQNPRASQKLRMYNCRLTALSESGYYHITLSIWLDGGRTSRDALVADIDYGSETLLSDYEAALQLASEEYITVFELTSDILESFSPYNMGMLSRADITACENGMLYTIYNETNSHVERSEYRISDDVYGYTLLSTRAELIIMSNNCDRITVLDETALFSVYSPYLKVKGRYRLDSPVFHTLCHTPGVSFEDLIEPDE